MLRYRLICLCLIFVVLSFGWQALAQDETPTEPLPTEAVAIPTEDPVIPLVTDEPVPIIPTEDIVLPTEEPTPVATEEIVTPVATEEAIVTPLPIPVTPDPLTAVFSTNFDAPAAEFPFGTGWTPITVENGLAVQSGAGETLSTYNMLFLDAAIRARVLFGSGTLTLTLRDSSTETAISRYSTTLANDGTLTLWRNESSLVTTILALPDGEWTALELRAIGAQLSVLVNGIETLSAVDSEPLPLGRISLTTALDSVLRVDDLAVLAQGEGVLIIPTATPIPTETPTLAPTVDVPASVTPDATAEPTSEVIEVEMALPQSPLPQAGPIGTGPTIISPINGSPINDNTPALNWVQVPTASSYTLQIATNTAFTANVQMFSGITNAQLPYSLPVLADGTYFARVQTHTPPSNFTNMGPVNRFTIDTVAPPQGVVPLKPANNAQVPTLRPTFTWTAVIEAASYQVQVDSLGTFVGGVGDLYNSPFVTKTTFTIPNTDAALKQGHMYFRVLPKDAAGNIGTAGRIVLFHTILALTPASETVISVARPTFTWAAVVGTGLTYTLQVAKDTGFTQIILEKPNLTTTRYLPTADLDVAPGGIRYWRVLVNGELPMSSGAGSIKFILNRTSLPAAPVLSAPAALTNDNTPTIVWTAPSHAASYEFQISETKTFATYPLYADTSVNPNATITTSLPDGTYYVRVRGINAAQAPGPYSAVRTFTIETHAPDAPTLKGPLDKAAVTGRPPFTWTALPAAQAVKSYRLDVSTDNFVTTLPSYTDRTVTGVSFTASTSIAVLPNGLYQWRLRAVDSAGNVSANSDPEVFYVLTTVLKQPVILTLKGAATGSPSSADTRPETTFTMTNPATLGTLTRSHEIQLSTVNTFVPANTITVSVTDLSLDDADWIANAVTQLPNTDGQVYSVRVRTVYKNGGLTANGPFSATRTFTLDTTVPDAPDLIKPVNGAVETTPRPAFKWEASSGAVSYRLDVSLNNFTSTLAAYTNRTVTGVSFTAPTSVAALANGPYQWRLRAVDAAGNISGNSLTGTFYMNSIVLTKPVITTLAGAATGSPSTKDTRPGVTLTTSNPAALGTLTRSHEIEFSTVKTFLPANTIRVSITDLSLDDVDWAAVVLPATAGQVYSVRVQTVYKDANNTIYGPFSAVRNFTLDTTAPLTPVVLTPTGISKSVRPTITWKASPTAKLYSVYDTIQGVTTLLGTSAKTSFVALNDLTQGSHTLTVLAEDALGNVSTEVPSSNKTYEVFIGTSPAASATIVKTGSFVVVPFAWNAVSGATSYSLQISTVKDDFTGVQPVVLPTPTTTKINVSLPNGADYYWRVLVNNVPLPNTVHHTLILVTGVLPPATLNAVEADNIINMADDSDGITFTWNTPTLMAGVSVSGYRVQTSTLSTFPPASTITSADLGLVTTYTAPANTLPETTKFWRVVTRYASEGGTNVNSAPRSLTIDRTRPTAPAISLPAANAVLNTTRPTITWSSTGTSYRLDIATDSGFTAFVPQYNNLTVPRVSLAVTSSLPQQTLFVRVRAVDAAGNVSLNSAPRSFGVFIGTGPAQSTVSSDTTPTFTWAPIQGVNAYTVQVDVDGNFSPSTYTFTFNGTGKTLTVPPGQALPSGAAYVWRVIATGDTSSTGLMRTLIISAPLTTPNLISPVNSFFINGND